MKQIGVGYLWSTLNLLHIAVVLGNSCLLLFSRAKFSRPILRCNSKSSINWFWFCSGIFLFFSVFHQAFRRFALFLSSWALKFQNLFRTFKSHQPPAEPEPNSKWNDCVIKCDGSWFWLLCADEELHSTSDFLLLLLLLLCSAFNVHRP